MVSETHLEMLDDDHAALISLKDREVTYLRMEKARWVEDTDPPIIVNVDWAAVPHFA